MTDICVNIIDIETNKSKKKQIEFEGSNVDNVNSNKRSRKMVKNDTSQLVNIEVDNNNSSLIESVTLTSHIPSLVDTIKLLHYSSSNEKNGIDLVNILTNHYFLDELSVNDSKFKLFNRIRHSIISEKSKPVAKQNLTGRIETEINYACYMDDLKFLITNVYRIDEHLNLRFEWKTKDVLKKAQQRMQFVEAFAKIFSNTYIEII